VSQATIQGTIRDYDAEGRRGSLLTDDRVEVTIDERSLGDEAIRLLRIGQRVRFRLEEDAGARVARDLRLVTFPD
jgi:cold shock CspA family protein